MSTADLGMFVVALVAVYLVPGADMLLVLETGSVHGRARAVAVAIGLGVARAAHVALAGLGAAALLSASPVAYASVRWIGAAWIGWIGLSLLRAGTLVPTVGTGEAGERAGLAVGWAFRRGLFTNLLNPKALLFCSVLLPQFVRAEAGPVAGRFLVLGAILVGIGFAFDLAFAMIGAALGRFLAARPRLARLQGPVFGGLLLAVAVRLALLA